ADPHSDSFPVQSLVVGNQFFFTADDGINGTELWVSNGTSSGTHLVRDINPGRAGSNPDQFVALGDLLLFRASDVGFYGNHELWRGACTAAGPRRVRNCRPGPFGSHPAWPTTIGNVVYFTADDGTSGTELWRTDGTAAGTMRVSDLRPGPLGSAPLKLQ